MPFSTNRSLSNNFPNEQLKKEVFEEPRLVVSTYKNMEKLPSQIKIQHPNTHKIFQQRNSQFRGVTVGQILHGVYHTAPLAAVIRN